MVQTQAITLKEIVLMWRFPSTSSHDVGGSVSPIEGATPSHTAFSETSASANEHMIELWLASDSDDVNRIGVMNPVYSGDATHCRCRAVKVRFM